MKYSYNKLQNYFEDKLPVPEKLAETFGYHLSEVENIERIDGDIIFDIKILPDRSTYAKSYEGLAMEISAVWGLKRKPEAIAVTSKKSSRAINVSIENINRTLGTSISKEEIITILERLDIGVTDNGNELTLAIPENRPDLANWRDIPEEVGRIYGYDKINATTPKKSSAKIQVEKTFYYSEKIKNFLVDQGFSEVYLYSLASKGDIELEKSVAQDKNFLRTDLTEGINKSLEFNVRNADLLGLDEIKIFEIGKVFPKEGEHTALSIGIKNVKKKQEKENEKIKKVRDELFRHLGSEPTILCTVDDSGGIISHNGKTIGHTNNIEGIMEVNLDALIENLPQPQSYDDLKFGKAVNIQYKKFSQYPFIVRDIAVFVPESVSADDAWKTIERGIEKAGARDLVARYSLFDTFKRDGKTSYAYRMVFQSHEKTLTDEEVNGVMDKVNEKVKGEGWEVR